jgi:hypothetical protein
MRTAVVTAFADNAIGRLIEDLILQGGVDASLIIWREYDGCGRDVRNGLNFTERGFGIRGAVGVSDREILPPPSLKGVILTGNIYLANAVSGGSIPAAYLPPFQKQHRVL